ncbi:methyl-accepting chemotaxis protein [Demequina salsinemoris]|uniref:methyl-accepting chemotaxis protein n=1 Tax=Demequina salsinemoris TaxID=577470 RepID=UPI000786491D|nr:methyl-accepting chemotaxis protein [Demequina salsinemoris]
MHFGSTHSPHGRGDHPLLSSTASLRAILDSLRANVFLADLDHNMIYANPMALEAIKGIHGSIKDSFGVDSGDMLGGQIHRFHSDPSRIARLLGDGRNFPREASFSFGETTLHTNINTVKDAAGKVIGYCVVWTDATWDESVGEVARDTSGRILDKSDRLDSLSRALTDQASRTSDGAQTAAAAVEQMSAAVKEIAGSTAQASTVARDAVDSASAASESVSKLDASSQEISVVVKLITQIADQTNLLALNATIEAARAGEAGKGFAVVASEVKELARETADATKRITDMIAGLQTNASEVTEALGSISGLIDQISEAQTSIAGAVEEQSATTNELAASVSRVAQAAQETTHDVAEIAQEVGDVRDETQKLQRVASGS